MEITRTLGTLGPVPAIALGCMGMSDLYGPADRAESVATVHAALDAGVTLLDTGDFYGSGHNELLLREALTGRRREDVLLSVKFGALRDPAGGWVGYDARPAAVKNSLAQTLRRLGTGHVDVHRPARLDPAVPIEDTVGAIAEMVAAGYVRHVGLSEVGPETIRRAHAVHPVADVQIEYSLLSRGIETSGVLATCRELGIGVTAYGVLSRGLLSGHWRPGQGAGDFRGASPRFQGENLTHNLALVERLREVAAQRGATVAQLAVAWVLSRGADVVPLVGARRRDRLAEALVAAALTLTAADVAAIEAAVPDGAAAGARYAPAQFAQLDSERGPAEAGRMARVDHGGLADFLRRRREGLAPADVGPAPGARRRTAGLRREEVAALTGMSVDYYVRLEQSRSPQPSPQMLRALARTLRLADDERDHLFRLAGQEPPARTGADAHVRPGVLRLIDRFTDGAAFVVSDTEVTLAANRLARLLLGDPASRTGRAVSGHWRWFTDPAERARHPADEHDHQARIRVADLRATWSRRRGDADVVDLVDALRAASPEFAARWAEHEVAVRRPDRKRLLHPAVGAVDVDCEILLQPADGQRLVLLSAAPGSEDQHKLDLLAVVGEQDGGATVRWADPRPGGGRPAGRLAAVIVVTGPTGNVGAELVRLLEERGVEHRVAAHRPHAGQVRLDYDDRRTWGPALDGVTRLFLLFPLPTPRAVDRRILPFLDAAVAAGCAHVVYLSVFGGDTQRLIPHHRVERAIEAAPVTHTILRCSFFMQNLFRAVSTHGVDIVERGEVFVPAGRGRITFLDARDAAEVALDALVHPDRHRDAGYALTGPEKLDFTEVARVLTGVLGRPVRYTAPSLPRFWRRLRRRGVPRDVVAFMGGVYLLTRLGRNEPVTDELPRLLGRPGRTLDAFAREERWRWETRTWS